MTTLFIVLPLNYFMCWPKPNPWCAWLDMKTGGVWLIVGSLLVLEDAYIN